MHYINSRSMAMTLALRTIDVQDRPGPSRSHLRVRRTRHANAAEGRAGTPRGTLAAWVGW